jgi:hypothetical protein
VWIITTWEHISPEVKVKGFNKCFISNSMDDTDNVILWNGGKEDGNVRSDCEEGKVLTVKMERVTLIG